MLTIEELTKHYEEFVKAHREGNGPIFSSYEKGAREFKSFLEQKLKEINKIEEPKEFGFDIFQWNENTVKNILGVSQ